MTRGKLYLRRGLRSNRPRDRLPRRLEGQLGWRFVDDDLLRGRGAAAGPSLGFYPGRRVDHRAGLEAGRRVNDRPRVEPRLGMDVGARLGGAGGREGERPGFGLPVGRAHGGAQELHLLELECRDDRIDGRQDSHAMPGAKRRRAVPWSGALQLGTEEVAGFPGKRILVPE